MLPLTMFIILLISPYVNGYIKFVNKNTVLYVFLFI